jgi:hypothetical protein
MPTLDGQEKAADKIVAEILDGKELTEAGLPLQFDSAAESSLFAELLRRDSPVLSTEGPVHGP